MNNCKKEKAVVLVVEDERPLSMAIAKKLGLIGFDVLTARTANQAMTYLEEVEKIDAIWLDHYLLGEDSGLDLVMKIKKKSKWSGIPVFVVSNTASPDKIKCYLELGVSKYYLKAECRIDDVAKEINRSLASASHSKKKK